ncbi:MAG: dihydrodipicolinate synthase family protein, partial [Burkholderiales bacterium]|nr:dihydrodipicolinate synthase family protein [Burkholderiales bacterium]
MSNDISKRLYSALLLPLKPNLDIDEAGLRTLVRHHLKNPEFKQRGGLIANPEAGEIFHMTREEQRRVLELVLAEA